MRMTPPLPYMSLPHGRFAHSRAAVSTVRGGSPLRDTQMGKTTHGQCGTRTHNCWRGILVRCTNQNARSYVNYGGRGITICRRWLDFAAFREDMGDCPSDQHTIERLDNDGHYEPSNCIWATRKEQARNRRTSRMVTFNGATMCLNAWSEKTGIARETLRARFHRGWTAEAALMTPSGKKP